MSADVGGRLETLEPHRSLLGPDYFRIFILLVAALGIHAWLVAHTAVPARDSLGYARVALNLSNPSGSDTAEHRHRIDVIRKAEQPPGYPVAIWITEKALRPLVNLPLAERSLLAAQLANAAAAVLLVVPIYLIGRILFSRNVGFASALLFEVLPIPARMTSDGLSEGVYLCAVATAILLSVRSVRRPSVGGFLLCGAAIGVSYLVRPEGLGVAVGTSAVIIWAGMTRLWPRDHALGNLAALLVGVAFIALPYMMLIGKISNKPTTNEIINPFNNQPGKIWKFGPESRLEKPVAGNELFAVWWDPKIDTGKSHELWAMKAVWTESAKSSHYVILLLALVGIYAHRRQLMSPDPGLWLLIALGVLNVGLMFYLAERIWYVSERHTLQFVLLSCIFAASAIKPLTEAVCSLPFVRRLVLWPQAAPYSLFLALVCSALPYTFATMHAQREGHKHAGQWLAEHMQPDDWLIDPFAWGEWYSGRSLYDTTHYWSRPKVKWVIIEEGKSSHSRLPQLDEAKELIQQGICVYRWPENPKEKDTVVCVYRVDAHDAKAKPPAGGQPIAPSAPQDPPRK